MLRAVNFEGMCLNYKLRGWICCLGLFLLRVGYIGGWAAFWDQDRGGQVLPTAGKGWLEWSAGELCVLRRWHFYQMCVGFYVMSCTWQRGSSHQRQEAFRERVCQDLIFKHQCSSWSANLFLFTLVVSLFCWTSGISPSLQTGCVTSGKWTNLCHLSFLNYKMRLRRIHLKVLLLGLNEADVERAQPSARHIDGFQ